MGATVNLTMTAEDQGDPASIGGCCLVPECGHPFQEPACFYRICTFHAGMMTPEFQSRWRDLLNTSRRPAGTGVSEELRAAFAMWNEDFIRHVRSEEE